MPRTKMINFNKKANTIQEKHFYKKIEKNNEYKD